MRHSDRAERLVAKGYLPVWIPPGDKRPAGARWTELRMTAAQAREGAANGHAGSGVGVICGVKAEGREGGDAVYGIDVDTYNDEVSRRMAEWLEREGLGGMRRYGARPKFLVPVRGAGGMRKLLSRRWVEPGGELMGESGLLINRLEVLGLGQQFVSFAVHPGVGRDYEWEGTALDDVQASDLPLADEAKLGKILDTFDRVCEECGLVVYDPAPRRYELSRATLDSRLGTERERAIEAAVAGGLSRDQAVALLARLPGGLDRADLSAILSRYDARDYEIWVRVGMAICFESSGSYEGLVIWDDWSQTGGDKYCGWEGVRCKWASFKRDGYDGRPVVTMAALARETAGGMVTATSHEGRQSTVARVLAIIEEEFAPGRAIEVDGTPEARVQARCESELRDEILALGKHERERLLGVLQAKMSEVREAKVKKAEVKAILDSREIAANCESVEDVRRRYLWLLNGDCWYDQDTDSRIAVRGFDFMFGGLLRLLGVDGSPTAYMSRYAAPEVVWDALYYPGRGVRFTLDGRQYANRYTAAMAPERRSPGGEDVTDDERQRLQRLVYHVVRTFGQEQAQVIMDFIAFTAQNPGRKIRWALVLVGVQGDGKNTVAELAKIAVGPRNMGMVGESEFESPFNGWAEGHMMKWVEEIYVSGENRHARMNRFKPLITNEWVSIHPKGERPRLCPCTANFMFGTNFMDALPLSEGDRRYYVAKTVYDSRAEVRTPEMLRYFNGLWDDLHDPQMHPLICGFFEEYRVSDGFSPDAVPEGEDGRGNVGKLLMMDASKGIAQEFIELLVEDENVPLVNEELVVTSDLYARLDMMGQKVTWGKVQKALARMGYHKHPKRVKVDGRPTSIWVKHVHGGRKVRDLLQDNDYIQDTIRKYRAALGISENTEIESMHQRLIL